MRHAVVVAPPRFEMPTATSVFRAPEPVGPLSQALTHGGHRLVLVSTTPELEADFERGLAGMGAGDDLVVYVACVTTTRNEAIALRLGDESAPTIGLRVVSDIVLVREPSSVLFIIEACHDGDPDDPMLAAEHVDALVRALDARARGYGVVVAVRPYATARPNDWPFTRHLLAASEDPESRDDRGAAPMSLVYDRLRAAHSIDSHVQSFAFVRGRTEFTLFEPPELVHFAAAVRHRSAPPPPVAPSVESEGPATDPDPESQPPPSSIPISSGGASYVSSGSVIAAAPEPEIRYADLPPMRAKEASIPPLEPLLALADGARERGAFEEALAGYKAALMVVPQTDTLGRAQVYTAIGEVKRAQGKPREAEHNYEKAYGADASHRPPLDALVQLAVESKDARRAIEWRKKRAAVLASDDERVADVIANARSHADDLGDTRAAAEAYEQALAMAPKTRPVLEGLRVCYEKLSRWSRVVEVLAELAELDEDPKHRAELRFAAADVALGRLRDEERGLGLLDRALDDDATHDKALHALVAVRTARGEWQALDAAYARLVDSFARQGDVERAWDACRKLGALRRDKLRDVAGATEAFTGAVSCKPSDVDSRAMLADMHLARGDEAQAVAEFERIAQLSPTRASTYARLFALHQRASRTDRAWLAGLALEELGAADMDQQLFVDQYRPEGPIRPSKSLDDELWDDAIRAPGADDVVTEVLRAITGASVAARVAELRDAKKLVTLDPDRRQSATSTVTAVRSFQWAANVMGMEAPDLYVLDNVPGGIAAVQAASPSTALGPDVLRGLSASDLAFLAGRHLTYYRREHYSLVCWPTLNELSALFLGAVKLVMPELPVPVHLGESISRARKLLKRHASDGEKEALTSAVKRLDARDGRVDLAAWIKSVELTAQRAGLLLCGDLAVAMRRIKGETRAIADLTAEQKRGDLLAFCASEKFARVREALKIDAKPSAHPPPMSEQQAG
jgi:tetratricopeptide (TPR) repeat protein